MAEWEALDDDYVLDYTLSFKNTDLQDKKFIYKIIESILHVASDIKKIYNTDFAKNVIFKGRYGKLIYSKINSFNINLDYLNIKQEDGFDEIIISLGRTIKYKPNIVEVVKPDLENLQMEGWNFNIGEKLNNYNANTNFTITKDIEPKAIIKLKMTR